MAKHPDADNAAPPPNMMAPEVWQEMLKRRNDFLESLKGLSVERFETPKEALNKIARVTQIVEVFLKEHEQDREEIKDDNVALQRLISILDNLTIWSAKFATECSGGASDSVALQKYDSETDSLYYTTHSGATMRLKVVELPSGLRAAAQPFTEKILFIGSGGDIGEQPKEGYRVEEFISPTFLRAIKDNKPEEYIPALKIYREGSIIKAVSRTNKDGKESFSPDHSGDRINKIFPLD